jgi:predicted AAA+ superfamily ATPase
VFLKHTQDFDLLRNLLEAKNAQTCFFVEVQRIPQMLDTIQSPIDENPKLKFYLTGSSARELRRGGASLLPGRVINYNLGALTLAALNYAFRVEDLKFGFLPGIYSETDESVKKSTLLAYSANYLNEEVKAEALVRDLPAFSRFLGAATDYVGQFVDYSKMSKKTKVPRHQIPRFFEILEDTLIGYRVMPCPDFIDRFDLIKHPKFYLFDVGVYNGLRRTFVTPSERLGVLTEQVVFQQLLHSAWAKSKRIDIYSLRTRGGAEVDFLADIDGERVGIEVNFSDNLIDDDVRHLNHFKKLEKSANFYLLHFGKESFKRNGLWCLPAGEGFKGIGL